MRTDGQGVDETIKTIWKSLPELLPSAIESSVTEVGHEKANPANQLPTNQTKWSVFTWLAP